MARVLLVDDEPNVLSALKRVLNQPGPPGLGADWLYKQDHCTDESLC